MEKTLVMNMEVTMLLKHTLLKTKSLTVWAWVFQPKGVSSSQWRLNFFEYLQLKRLILLIQYIWAILLSGIVSIITKLLNPMDSTTLLMNEGRTTLNKWIRLTVEPILFTLGWNIPNLDMLQPQIMPQGMVRYGLITRDEAITLVKKHDHALDPLCVRDFLWISWI